MALVNQGRQDWQRNATSDSTALLNLRNQGEVGTVVWGPFNVASFATLAGIVTLHGGGYVRFDVSYFTDQAGTIFLGTRRFALDSATAATCQLSHRCLGPWVTITAQPINAGQAWNLDLQLAAVDRFTEMMFTPLTGIMAAWGLTSIGPAVTDTINFPELFAGAVTFSGAGTAAGMEPWVEAQTASGVWVRVIQGDMVGTNHFHRQGVLPPLPCRALINNPTAGAISFAASVVASLTGST